MNIGVLQSTRPLRSLDSISPAHIHILLEFESTYRYVTDLDLLKLT